MLFNFKKNIIVGVSITPEVGLEVAQVDFDTRTVLKYGSRPLTYDNNRREIADLDIFKETLQDLLIELDIPKDSEIALNLPPVYFKVTDYPASLTQDQVMVSIEEDLVEHPIFQNNDPCLSIVRMPNSTIQFSKYASNVVQKSILIEIAMQIRELGYNIASIDTSVNSVLNALIFNERINTASDFNWVLLIVDNSCCRIIPMAGSNYVDSFEEKISIGEVLGDAENYATVVNAASPILKNVPSKCLYVISKTNIISAKILSEQLKYNAPIIHQESNVYNTEKFIETVPEINEDTAKQISIDVIGAVVKHNLSNYPSGQFNLFNASLGDVYVLYQPPVITIAGHKIVMTLENAIPLAIAVFVGILILSVAIMIPLRQIVSKKQQKINNLDYSINNINKFLKDNENISSELFDEGDEIRMGLVNNKNIYTYYTVVGTEIPQKLWLTHLTLGKYTTIKGQADNLESVYSFFRNIKDYNQESLIKLQKLGLATADGKKYVSDFEEGSILTSMNADFYEFEISDVPPEVENAEQKQDAQENKAKPAKKSQKQGNKSKNKKAPNLEIID